MAAPAFVALRLVQGSSWYLHIHVDGQAGPRLAPATKTLEDQWDLPYLPPVLVYTVRTAPLGDLTSEYRLTPAVLLALPGRHKEPRDAR